MDKGISHIPSDESEEIFDDEIQSSSEGSINEDNLNSNRQGSDPGGTLTKNNNDGEEKEGEKVLKVLGKSDI